MDLNEPLHFANRVAIVTGSGRGMGREHALLLGRLGAAVIVNSITPATAEETVQDIIKTGGKAIAYVGSVTDRAVADAMVKLAVETFGRIDIIINNAGAADPRPFEDTSEVQLWDQLRLHLGGAFNMSQAAWPHMLKQSFGRIVMILSATLFGMPNNSSYVAAKMAMLGLARSIALEGKPHNVLVNSIATSGFTPGFQKAIKSEEIQAMAKVYMSAADVAPAVAWLAHESCQISGEALSASGKFVSRIFLAETQGFIGGADNVWVLETIRDHWEEIMDEKDYVVHKTGEDVAKFVFGRMSQGQASVSEDDLTEAFARR